MNTKRIIAFLLLTTICAMPVIARAHDPLELQKVMFRLLRHIERAAGIDHEGSQAIRKVDEESMTILYNTIEDKDRFFESAYAALERIKTAKATVSEPEPDVTDLLPAQLYPPNYPPTYSAAYNIVKVLGLTASNEDRCDGVGLEIYEDIYYAAEKLADVADAVCTGAGCDPTGAICLGACLVVKGYTLAVLAAKIPLDACNKHGEGVDSAEIEAGYENGKSIFDNLGTHDDNLTTHDTEIKAELALIKTQLLKNQALLEEIIKLLKTPQGRRPGWRKDGY